MRSRLKGIETRSNTGATAWVFALDMRSRLKGIETLLVSRVTNPIFHFGYAFPFEGN